MTAITGTRRRENTRVRLLAAAHAVFGEAGLSGASVEAICERAGFTRGAFYSNFGSKDELFLALIVQLSQEKLDEVAVRVRDLDGDVDPRVDPVAIVDAVVGASAAAGVEPQLVAEIRVQALRDARLAEAYLAWQEMLRARVEAIMRTVAERFDLSLRVDLREAAQLLLDTTEQTFARAALERRAPHEAGELLNTRLAQLVAMLVS